VSGAAWSSVRPRLLSRIGEALSGGPQRGARRVAAGQAPVEGCPGAPARQRATCRGQRATCRGQQATCRRQNTTRRSQRTTCRCQRTTGRCQRNTCRCQRNTCRGQRKTCHPLAAPSLTATGLPLTTTSAPLTATSLPLTATSLPLTATGLPLMATSLPLTATGLPLTATSLPLTSPPPPGPLASPLPDRRRGQLTRSEMSVARTGRRATRTATGLTRFRWHAPADQPRRDQRGRLIPDPSPRSAGPPLQNRTASSPIGTLFEQLKAPPRSLARAPRPPR
jgi:hypothetical protein